MREFESDIFFSFNNQEDLLDSNKRLSGKLYVSNSNDIRIEYIKLANPMDIVFALSPQSTKPFVVYGQNWQVAWEKQLGWAMLIQNIAQLIQQYVLRSGTT